MTTKFRRPAPRPATFAAVFATVVICGPWPVLAALPCGIQPERVPVELAPKIKEEANAILQAPQNLALRALVLAKRRELRQKNEEVEASIIDHDLLWVICQTIAKDRTLAATQQFNQYSDLYRLLSEPIAKAAAPAE